MNPAPRAPHPASRALQVDRAVQHHARHADGHDQRSIVLISLPGDLPRHRLNPLEPGNVSYLLWMLMGYMLVTAVLVVTLGRLGDMYGRVKIYNLGFAIFTSPRSCCPRPADTAGRRAVADRLAGRAGVGGAMLMANSAAILTDAFPPTSAAWRWASTGRRASPARSSAWCSAACWRRVGLALGLLGQRADRPVRHGLGVQVAARLGRPPAGQDRLVGQHHLRRRPDRAARRDHLRHPALRRPHHGLDQPVGAGRADRRRRAAGRVLRHRDEGRRADVPAALFRSARSRAATRPACSPRSPAAACSSC
jgi:hypothetical protein